MEYQSPFRLTEDEYHRDIDIIDAYYEQLALYIHTVTAGKYSLEFCREQVEDMFKPGGELVQDFPVCKMWVRNQKTGDREEKYTTVDRLFRTVIDKQIISAPSLTFYVPEHVKRSKLAEFTAENVRKRAVVKKEMYVAAAAGNEVLKINKKNEQNAVKTLNNGMSGAFSSPYTVIFNQSSHSVLTSTCRTATSFGNAGNERLLGGRRHYDTPSRVLDHFLSIGTLTDWQGFKACMDKYNLHYPSVDEVMEVVEHSSKDYFINPEGLAFIRQYATNTTALTRAAFVYMGDFYHLAKYNDQFMRGFIGALIAEEMEEEITDWDAAEKSIDGDMEIIISQFRTDIVPLGKSFSDVKLKDEDTNKAEPWEKQDKYKELIRSAVYLQKTIGHYACLIRNVLTTKNLPINIARMPDVVRSVGVVSDTDSTMMTAQWWAQWYTGQHYGREATRVSDAMIYLATQHLRHLMASMSVNIGVAKERLFLYAMKNEYKFDSFALTTKAKHYFSIITGQEGQLKKDPELEVKGVSLRTSNIPPVIMKEFKRTIKQLCEIVARGDKIEIIPLLEKVAGIEHTVANSIRSGNAGYLKTTNIKERTAYNENDEKNYHYHRFYNEVFGPKFGHIGEPPYDGVKLPVSLQTKTAVKEWLESIKDPMIKASATQWFESTNFRTYRTLILPEHLVENYGIPQELIDIADIRRTAFATVEPYYHILECLGVFMMDKNRTRLLSDYYGESLDAELAEALAEVTYVRNDEREDEDEDEEEGGEE
ncbi:hypothetical protein STRATTON_33 [Erwinia phage vB_EamM_Stratton]|uniref:Uncharacterized protein n=2 Tax=Erskinevirus EaH2 TaxID=2169883 RepID=A0A1B2IGR7_9CAUD|nr:DNA polymerase [Erwinia phage phiEaH2]AFQ96745.1 hypothetical protein [Erwinia phage phiEaH2]ANZ50458.1 hypothetical protein STRATTON_33 [Erwinia phage vB_EamM_Stratton]